MDNLLVCPVCGKNLINVRGGSALACGGGHSFDVAKEGYVNLLTGSKPGGSTGDDKISCRSRRDFLSKGYYAPLREFLVGYLSGKSGSLIDICCGEGYYTSALGGSGNNIDVYGFDISKEAVRLAAKRGGAVYFVANLTKIPVKTGSFDFATQLFSPFCEEEFARILRPGGQILSVVPGKRHLWGLKETLYDRPYENDEAPPRLEKGLFSIRDTARVRKTVRMPAEDAEAVFRMTPYFFRTSLSDKEKLGRIDSLTTETEFAIYIMERK